MGPTAGVESDYWLLIRIWRGVRSDEGAVITLRFSGGEISEILRSYFWSLTLTLTHWIPVV